MLLTGLVSCVSAQTITPLFPSSDRLDNPYGVCAHISRIGWDWEIRDAELKMMKEASIGWVRTDFEYNTVRPITPADTFRTETYMSMMKSCDDSNVCVLGVIGNGKGKNYAWNDRKQYSKFLDHIINTYSQKKIAWEVMNEVDHIKDDSGYCKKYVDVLKEAYERIKTSNPEGCVLLSGLADIRRPFADSLFLFGAQNYCDIINIHIYDKPESLPQHFKRIRLLMDKYGFSKSVWLTECGMHTAIDSVRHIGRDEKQDEQARRIARIFLISYAYGIDKVLWYNLKSREKDDFYNEDHFGLLHKDLTPKPAFQAYKTLVAMCPSGSTRPTLEVRGKTYLSSWCRPDGKNVWAVWSTKENGTAIKIQGKYSAFNWMGKRIKKNVKNAIGTGVTYYVGAKSIDFN